MRILIAANGSAIYYSPVYIGTAAGIRGRGEKWTLTNLTEKESTQEELIKRRDHYSVGIHLGDLSRYFFGFAEKKTGISAVRATVRTGSSRDDLIPHNSTDGAIPKEWN